MMADRQLRSISDACSAMGADVRYDPEYRRLIVLAWEDKGEQNALSIQKKVQQQTAECPELVCYCFDLFSTLVYTI